MTITYTSPSPGCHRRNSNRGAVDLLPTENRWPKEISEAVKQFELEQAVRKATAQLRHSVNLAGLVEDGLHSPISGRRIPPCSQRSFPGQVSRCHQRN